MAVTRDEVVASALQLEKDGRAFYLEAAAKASSEVVKQVLVGLADDELLHIEWIEKMLPAVEDGDVANRQLYGKLRAIFVDGGDAEKQRAATSGDDIAALKYAFDIEEKSQTTYADWAKETDDEEVRNLCTVLADVEKFHAELISNSIEYLQKPGDWFQQQERWFFEG